MAVKDETHDDENGKLFVGGLSWETTQDNLQRYFSRYGEVIDCVVMKDSESGRSRGFGFVTFSDPSNVGLVLQNGPHHLDGRTIDPKQCNPRSQQQQKPKRSGGFPKVFLGGLPSNVTQTELRSFFQRFGKVMEVVIMYDQEKKKSRGFGFVTFEDEDAVDRCVAEHFVELNGKQVEIKRAEARDSSNKMNYGRQGQRSPQKAAAANPDGLDDDADSKSVGNKDEAESCIENAKRCAREKNFDEAKKHLERAQQLYPKILVEDLLEQMKSQGTESNKPENENIWKYDTTHIFDCNKDEAERCIEFAECCIRENKLEIAKKYLEKAQRLYPKMVINGLLQKLASMATKNKTNARDNGSAGGVDPSANTCRRKEEAKRYMKLAEDYMREKKLDDAKKYLTKSRELYETLESLILSEKLNLMFKKKIPNKNFEDRQKCPTTEGTANPDINANNNTPKTETRNPYDGVAGVANKEQADRCQELAERCIREEKFEDAKRYLEKAQRLHPSKKTEELLKKVASMSAKKNDHSTPKNTGNSYGGVGGMANKEQADRCLELAEKCILEQKYEDAKRYLEKAQRLHPSRKTEELLEKVASMSAKKKHHSTPQSDARTAYGGVGETANKDQADRCRERAERCMNEKRYVDAEKYLRKAQKLYPTDKTAELLRIVMLMSNQNAYAPKTGANSRQSSGPRAQPTITYTKEQLAVVTRINKSKNSYEILGVTRQASMTEIRHAYKKLALLVHPDKNKAPGATEAFRAAKNAVTDIVGF